MFLFSLLKKIAIFLNEHNSLRLTKGRDYYPAKINNIGYSAKTIFVFGLLENI